MFIKPSTSQGFYIGTLGDGKGLLVCVNVCVLLLQNVADLEQDMLTRARSGSSSRVRVQYCPYSYIL